MTVPVTFSRSRSKLVPCPRTSLLPEPPDSVSRPAPARMESFPSPPRMKSSPRSPRMKSAPEPPVMTSFPSEPTSDVLPVNPLTLIVSLPVPPRTVTIPRKFPSRPVAVKLSLPDPSTISMDVPGTLKSTRSLVETLEIRETPSLDVPISSSVTTSAAEPNANVRV